MEEDSARRATKSTEGEFRPRTVPTAGSCPAGEDAGLRAYSFEMKGDRPQDYWLGWTTRIIPGFSVATSPLSRLRAATVVL